MNISISQELLKEYILLFWPSLKHFATGYEPIIFKNNESIPDYLMYICPLCLSNYIIFTREGLFSSAEFDMDHFPPKNAGGTLKAFVCKPCNSRAGHEFDYITKEFLNQRGFQNRVPYSIIETQHTISGVIGSHSGTIGIDEKGEIEISLKRNPKSKIKPLDEFLNQRLQSPTWQAEVTIPRTDHEILAKALLKAAYLTCFNHWGYDFIFSDTGNYIRETLTGNNSYPFKNNPAFVFDKKEGTGQIPLGVCFLKEPTEWQVYMVNMPLKDKKTRYACVVSVLIPPPGGWNDFHKLNDIILDDRVRDIKIQPLNPGLLRKKYDAYSTDWYELVYS